MTTTEVLDITWQEYAERYGSDALPATGVDPHAFVPVLWITEGRLA
jgi:hypothetical protein